MFLFYNNEEFARKFISPTYEQTVNGLKLTSVQDKELRELYSRSVLPVKVWADVFAAAYVSAGIGFAGAVFYTVRAQDLKGILAWTMFMWAWAVVFGVKYCRTESAKKQLNNKIAEIKKIQYSR